MRALPGRSSRTSLDEPANLTKENVPGAQRQRILRATGELIGKRGYNDVSVELIVKRARVSFKTFYKHFSNKEEAFLELFDSFMGGSQAQIDRALASEPDSAWPRQVGLAIRAVFDTILADPIVARACIVEAPTLGPVIVDRYERAMKALTPLLRQGREYDPQAARLPETLEDTLAGGVLWSAYQRLVVGEVDRIEALLPEAVEFALRPYVGDAEAARWAGMSFEAVAGGASASG